MTDNVLQTLQRLLQDVIAPDVREIKVRLESLAKETDVRFNSVEERFKGVDRRFEGVEARFKGVDARFDTLEKQMDSMQRSILSAIAESRAQTELSGMTAMAALRERGAVLESQRNQPSA